MQHQSVKLLTLILCVFPAITLFNMDAQGQIAPGTTAYRTNMLLCLDISPDNSRIIVGGTDLRLFDVKTGEELLKLTPPELTRATLFSPTNADLFATGGDDQTVRIWNIDKAEPVHILKGHSARILSLAYSPDGKLLASGGTLNVAGESSLGELRLWDTETGELLQSITYDNCDISGLSFSKDGTRLAFARNEAVGGPASSIKLYDVKKWELVKSISFEPGFASSTTFTPDDRGLVIAGGECVPVNKGCHATGRLWLTKIDADNPPRLIDTPECEYFGSPDFTVKGDRFVIGTATMRDRVDRAGNVNGYSLITEIQMRSAETGELLWAQDGERGSPRGLTISPDQTFIACCSDLQVLIVDPDTGNRIRSIQVERVLTPYP